MFSEQPYPKLQHWWIWVKCISVKFKNVKKMILDLCFSFSARNSKENIWDLSMKTFSMCEISFIIGI